MVRRVALASGAALALAALGVLALSVRSDLPLGTLTTRHAALVLSGASTFVRLPSGYTVHLRDEGPRDGQVLVLLHDADSSLHVFEAWAATLKAHYRVVSFDLPGHGLTGPIPGAQEDAAAMVPVLDEVARTLGLERFALAGNGMGGALALYYALAHPERVSALVLIAPQDGPAADSLKDAPVLFRLAETPVVGGLSRYANLRGSVRARLERRFFDDARVSDEMVARDWLLLRHAGNREALRARLSRGASDSVIARLGGLAKPALLLWGAEDEIAPVKDAARYQEALPEAALVVFEKVGHFVQAEASAESAAIIHAFLQGEPVGALADAAAMKRVYGDVPPLPAMPVKPVEIRVLGPLARDSRLPSP